MSRSKEKIEALKKLRAEIKVRIEEDRNFYSLEGSRFPACVEEFRAELFQSSRLLSDISNDDFLNSSENEIQVDTSRETETERMYRENAEEEERRYLSQQFDDEDEIDEAQI